MYIFAKFVTDHIFLQNRDKINKKIQEGGIKKIFLFIFKKYFREKNNLEIAR
jgi:hypothetical protein